jgi:hypothetical protein
MCGPFYSTTWFEDWAEVPEYAFGIPDVPKNKKDIENHLSFQSMIIF